VTRRDCETFTTTRSYHGPSIDEQSKAVLTSQLVIKAVFLVCTAFGLLGHSEYVRKRSRSEDFCDSAEGWTDCRSRSRNDEQEASGRGPWYRRHEDLNLSQAHCHRHTCFTCFDSPIAELNLTRLSPPSSPERSQGSSSSNTPVCKGTNLLSLCHSTTVCAI
jgi:hypothetical protein